MVLDYWPVIRRITASICADILGLSEAIVHLFHGTFMCTVWCLCLCKYDSNVMCSSSNNVFVKAQLVVLLLLASELVALVWLLFAAVSSRFY